MPANSLGVVVARDNDPALEKRSGLSIVIPTFGREAVLIETVQRVLSLGPSEVLVADQTADHDPQTIAALMEWDSAGRIRWMKLSQPSIPSAMNIGARAAVGEIVLFLDDDVIPSGQILGAHERAYALHSEAWAVVGQVLQPGETAEAPMPGGRFRFNSTQEQWIGHAIACNFSVRRDRFLEVGGFDENFIGAAYCFETEFAERLIRSGGKVLFEPKASIRHLRAERGGTRAHGHHLTTASPAHSVGDYYHLLSRHGVVGSMRPVARRLLRSVVTRHHLQKPWYIPLTLVSEIRGVLKALHLHRRGPRLLVP